MLLWACSLTLDIALPKIRSPLEGEAVACVNLARLIASPLMGEAERSSDEGGIDSNIIVSSSPTKQKLLCIPRAKMVQFCH